LAAQGLGRLQDSAFGDLIVPIIVLVLCLVSLGIGIGKVVNNASGVRAANFLNPASTSVMQQQFPLTWHCVCDATDICSCAVAICFQRVLC
jgi:hypothetical protein